MKHTLNFENKKATVNLFLPDETKPDKAAVDELAGFTEIEDTIAKCSGKSVLFKEMNMKLEQIAVTPDFHKGSGISFDMKMLYDSPHNYIWKKQINGQDYYLHRKGACSALGMEDMAETPFAYYGEPVMIPGSMGSSSYLLKGMGTGESLWSASHGAGRRQSRGEALHGNDKEFEAFMKQFHIITSINPDRADLKGRKDILKKWEDSIRAEAPYAYKDIDQVVKVHEQHGMAGIVARMEPVFTVKA